MDEARTEYSEGKVNIRFQQFADDYGFHIHPCIARMLRTKAKVEAPMNILDEIRAYNVRLNYRELNDLVTRINNRVNTQVNQGTGRIPLLYFNKEKTFLGCLPADFVRKPYRLTSHTAKVNHSSIFQFHRCQYSVLPEYVGKTVTLQIYDGYIHVYYNTDFITMHAISRKKLNYHSNHYAAIARKSHAFKEEYIADRQKENLETIGRYTVMNSTYNQLCQNIETLKLNQMLLHLDEIVDFVTANNLSFTEGLLKLSNYEVDYKEKNASRSMIKAAAFPFVKELKDYDFNFQPSVNEQELKEMCTLGFLEKNENIVFLRPSGVGKTHLATSIGIAAAKKRYSTYFIKCHELLQQ